jgi:hypothetical protein
MKQISIVIPVLIMLILGGCIYSTNSVADNLSLPVRLLYEGVHGGGDTSNPNAYRIATEDQLQKIYNQFGKLTFGAVKRQAPNVDFSREEVLFVAMGQKPTAGYQLQLHQNKIIITNEAAVLSLAWIEPPAGAILPQVITSPCILVALPMGNYSRIYILDQKEQKRLEVSIR